MFTNKNLFSNACKLVLCTVLLSTLFSCDLETNVSNKEIDYKHFGRSIKVYEIDSCEYIYFPNGNASWGAHKGNCKFCAQRNSK
jgi:hypothetical protein